MRVSVYTHSASHSLQAGLTQLRSAMGATIAVAGAGGSSFLGAGTDADLDAYVDQPTGNFLFDGSELARLRVSHVAQGVELL
jgi:hypothetical protein